MHLGLLTDCLADVSLPEIARWAAETGFRTLETPVAARGPSWSDGARLVPARLDDAALEALDELLTASGLRIGALSCCDNMLEGDEAARAAKWKFLADTVRLASKLHVPAVTCLVGRDAQQRIGESIAQWARLAAETIRAAEEGDVRLALVTAPLCGAGTGPWEDMPANLAFAPELWEKIFTHARSEAVGLCFSPADLHWLGVDCLEAITAYAERIYHVRAKDAEVFRDRLSDCSCLRPQGGWWRYRLPGLGEIPWRRLFDRLQENGYDGAVVIEHADPVWSGTQDRVKRGLEFSRAHLSQLIV